MRNPSNRQNQPRQIERVHRNVQQKMSPFTAKIEMRGTPAAYMIGFGIFILFFAVMLGVLVWYGEAPQWFGWIMVVPMMAGSLWLFIWAGICLSRHVYWSFEANEEKIHWFRSDRRGVIRDEKEVTVREIVEVWRPRGGDTSGLYLKLRSGDCIEIGSVAQPEGQFLDWIAVNYPSVSLKIE